MISRAGILAALLLVTFCACGEEVKGGEITIRNDIMDDEYNSFVVDQIKTATGMKGTSKTLKPGQEFKIPAKKITGMRFTRRYKDHSKVYVIKCPADADRRVTIKMLDVHTKKVSGDCVIINTGRTKK